MEGQRIPFGVHRQTLDLRQHLKQVTDADRIVTYAELSAVADGADVQTTKRGWLATAIRMDERESEGRLWGCVRGIGIKLLSPDEAVEIGKDGVSRIRKISRKSLRRLAKANVNAMSHEAQTRLNVSIAVLGTLELFSKSSSEKKIEQHVINDGKINVDETLRLFHKT